MSGNAHRLCCAPRSSNTPTCTGSRDTARGRITNFFGRPSPKPSPSKGEEPQLDHAAAECGAGSGAGASDPLPPPPAVPASPELNNDPEADDAHAASEEASAFGMTTQNSVVTQDPVDEAAPPQKRQRKRSD